MHLRYKESRERICGVRTYHSLGRQISIYEAGERDQWAGFISSKDSSRVACTSVKFMFVSTDGFLFRRCCNLPKDNASTTMTGATGRGLLINAMLCAFIAQAFQKGKNVPPSPFSYFLVCDFHHVNMLMFC